MKLSDKAYDILKWLALVGIPLLTTFYVTIAPVVNLPYADEIAKVSAALCALIGGLIGVSSVQYYKGEHE